MKEISLHILDVVENGIAAGGDLITILVEEAPERNILTLEVSDNGRGVSQEVQAHITDPFYTTRTTRKVGMGLSLLKAAAERCGGGFSFSSREKSGSTVVCSFLYNHIDRAPLGDMPQTFVALLAGYPDVDFNYRHTISGKTFEMKTRDIRHELEGIALNEPSVLSYLKSAIREGLDGLKMP
ncbi:MAG: ATP-binding protein [Desulfobacterales bacterium]|nr:ATP-binding protein [Desulfobacterales bacterium]